MAPASDRLVPPRPEARRVRAHCPSSRSASLPASSLSTLQRSTSTTTIACKVRDSGQLWERRAGRPLSDEEPRQVRENLCGFFRVLAEWDQTGPRGALSDAIRRSLPVDQDPTRGRRT